MRIGIIGGGPAGIVSAIAASTALQGRKARVSIDVFESAHPFRGRSFNTDSPSMLLNTSIGVTFIDPADPLAFLGYLRREEGLSVGRGDVVPRDVARRYLEAEFARATGGTVACRVIDASIDNVSVDAQGRPQLHSSRGIETCDAVVLATGLQFRGPPPSFPAAETISPYPAGALASIDKDAPVLVLGSRLAAVDAILTLAHQGHRGPIIVHSPSGLFPSVRRATLKLQSRPLLEEFLKRDADAPAAIRRSQLLLDLFKLHVEAAGMELSDFIAAANARGRTQLDHEIRLCEEVRNVWEPVVLDLIDGLNHIWPKISTEEKRHFHCKDGAWLIRIVASMPLRNAVALQCLFERGQLQMVGADEMAATSDRYRYVINATGLLPADADPLLRRMSDHGLLRFNGGGGIRIDTASYRANPDVPIYANGAIVKDEVFMSSALLAAAQGAQRIALDLHRRWCA